jgi:hypothetical protein
VSTRGDFKSRLRRELGLHSGTTLGGDPFSLNDIVREAADEVASRTDCLYGQRTADLTAGTVVYCLPDFYKPKVVDVLDASGEWQELTIVDDPGDMDALAGPAWRTENGADPPTTGVFYGVNTVHVSPPPSVSRTAALRFEGYRKPGEFWVYDSDTGLGVTLTDSHECPLPVWAHEAVYRCARLKAAAIEAATRPEIGKLLAFHQQQYDGRGGELGRVEANAALHHRRMRQRSRSPRRRVI